MHGNANTGGMCGLLEHWTRDGKGRWSHFSPFEQLLAWRSLVHFWWRLESDCLSLLRPLLCDHNQFWTLGVSWTPTLPIEGFRSSVSCLPHGLPRQSLASWLQLQYFSCISFIVGADVWFCHFSHSMTLPVHFFRENYLTFRVVTFLSWFGFFG